MHNDQIKSAVADLVNIAVNLRSAVEEYTNDTEARIEGLMCEVNYLKSKVSKNDITMRKIAAAIMEEQDGQ